MEINLNRNEENIDSRCADVGGIGQQRSRPHPQADHALLQLINPFLKSILENTPDPNYGNLEEKRVTTGSEQKTARALGEITKDEVTRTDHRGFPYNTISPISTDEDFGIEFEIIINP